MITETSCRRVPETILRLALDLYCGGISGEGGPAPNPLEYR